jgi:ankyrin repeat protein
MADDQDKKMQRRLSLWLKAAALGDADDLRTLAAEGANVGWTNASGSNAVHLAASRGLDDASALIFLIQAKAPFDAERASDGKTPLIVASMWGRHTSIVALLGAGARVNAQDQEGWTAAMWAAKNNHVDCLAALIEAGADLDVRGPHGTALEIASMPTSVMAGPGANREACERMLSAWSQRQALALASDGARGAEKSLPSAQKQRAL